MQHQTSHSCFLVSWPKVRMFWIPAGPAISTSISQPEPEGDHHLGTANVGHRLRELNTSPLAASPISLPPLSPELWCTCDSSLKPLNMLLCLLVFNFSSSVVHLQPDSVVPAAPQHAAHYLAQTESIGPLTLTATPDYPVAEGQKVIMHCSGPTSANVVWSWQRQQNQLWQDVGIGNNLTLSEPGHSGLYRCNASNKHSDNVSPTHNVYIVSFHATEVKSMEITAFTLSLLALTVNIIILLWLLWERLLNKKSSSNTGPKGFPRPGKEPKGALPQAENDGHEYMNYSSTNLAYTDLDPTSMTSDNTYSILS
ncbi:uncharacterized protein LOC129192693 isoform X2 [Dunckerocampus dactyliophorus]|uniref:uncharacterized protein LOC129192693 isoform X2 n=1 Tax=Dunckerocampus dactyliophorus TaxID=161453 RepID=UPI002406A0F3|nr:uncharacterized protein LOC129192693 isoform X2 [Dunckerocampus dactyliophorus]